MISEGFMLGLWTRLAFEAVLVAAAGGSGGV